MKTNNLIIIAAIILFTSGRLTSQEYIPLCNENKAWNEMFLGMYDVQTVVNIMTGDTIIENISYKKVYSTPDTSLNT